MITFHYIRKDIIVAQCAFIEYENARFINEERYASYGRYHTLQAEQLNDLFPP